GCILDGKLYPFGETPRTEGYLRCSCSPDVMHCCSLDNFYTPVNYDKKNCKVIFNNKSCDYDMVWKDDPSKECFVYSCV
ncbi:Beta-microseminoprotein, partial [Eurypyga helias]